MKDGRLLITNWTLSEISTQQAQCVTPFGSVEGTISEIPLLISQQLKETRMKSVNESMYMYS